MLEGDITKIDEKDIAKHDILCGGFPETIVFLVLLLKYRKPLDESDTTLQKTYSDSLVFEGNGSGLVELDSVNDFFELINSEFVSLSSIYNDNMLELNYKCDHSFKVGIAMKSIETGEIVRFEALHIDSSYVWNKIYVHMTNQVNLGTTDDEFGIFIGIKKRANVETATFYFDNIKWLHKE